jgi:transcriptional regulator with XRE-family HTH domain
MERLASSVHPPYMKQKPKPPQFRRQFAPTFIRQWREHRGLTLEQLASRIGTTHASLSRVERGLQPYNQPLLEAVAEALRTDAASLIMRNPADPEGIWSVWDNAKPAERRQIVEIAKTLLKTVI